MSHNCQHPNLRFRCIDISFSFIIGRDIKSRIRNSDLNILKEGQKIRYQSSHEENKPQPVIYVPLVGMRKKTSTYGTSETWKLLLPDVMNHK